MITKLCLQSELFTILVCVHSVMQLLNKQARNFIIMSSNVYAYCERKGVKIKSGLVNYC